MDLGCRMINQIAELVDNPNTRFEQLMTLHRKIYNLEIIPRRPEPCPLRRQNMTSVRRIGSLKIRYSGGRPALITLFRQTVSHWNLFATKMWYFELAKSYGCIGIHKREKGQTVTRKFHSS